MNKISYSKILVHQDGNSIIQIISFICNLLFIINYISIWKYTSQIDIIFKILNWIPTNIYIIKIIFEIRYIKRINKFILTNYSTLDTVLKSDTTKDSISDFEIYHEYIDLKTTPIHIIYLLPIKASLPGNLFFLEMTKKSIRNLDINSNIFLFFKYIIYTHIIIFLAYNICFKVHSETPIYILLFSILSLNIDQISEYIYNLLDLDLRKTLN